MTALEPCPWCGSSGDVLYSGLFECHRCDRCHIDGPPGMGLSEAESARLWNTRPPLATDEELAALQRWVDLAYDDAMRDCTLLELCPDYVERGVVSASAVSKQRRAATLSALERRLRGVE